MKITKNLDIRYLYHMKSVLYDQKWAKTAPNFELYYMYRGIKQKKESTLLNNFTSSKIAANQHLTGLRYDITIIPPKMLGKEFIKTKGHYHIGKFQELYKVLQGQAILLMQKGKNIIEDVCIIKAKKNDIVIIPSDYGHITINPSKKNLKMANWISEKCKSDYKPIEKKGGACYFYTIDGWVKNKNYKKVPKLRFEKPLKKMPANLDFLKK